MNYSIIITSSFEKEAKRLKKKYPSLKKELSELITSLEVNPARGVSLGRNCYKIRLAIASKGKGKFGGARVISFVSIIKTRVYLVSIFDKSEQENISSHELIALLRNIS